MHTAVRTWIKRIKGMYPSYFHSCDVLEIGSRDVNGSARDYFQSCRYTGIDIAAGKSVDLVESAVSHKARGKKYATIVCTEVLEHDANWSSTLQAMRSMLSEHGLLIITAAGPNRPEHGTHECTPEDSPETLDYYRNLTKEMIYSVFRLYDFILQECVYNEDETDIYFYGILA